MTSSSYFILGQMMYISQDFIIFQQSHISKSKGKVGWPLSGKICQNMFPYPTTEYVVDILWMESTVIDGIGLTFYQQ